MVAMTTGREAAVFAAETRGVTIAARADDAPGALLIIQPGWIYSPALFFLPFQNAYWH